MTRRTSPTPPVAASVPASFSLDDDADGTLSNTRTFANLVPGSGFSVAQTVPSGWYQNAASCNDGSPFRTSPWLPGKRSRARSMTAGAAR